MPGCAAAAAISFSVLTASHGYSTAQPGTPRNMARSSRAICEGPSSPIDTPQWLPANLTLTWLMPAMRTKSAARVRNAANVAANGMAPRAARPIAIPTITCSAMNAW